MKTSTRLLSTTVRAFLLLTVLLGVIYPLVIFGVGRVVSDKTDGSFDTDSSGKVVGSSLIAQAVTEPGYFMPRPSAAGDDGYDAMSSSASNLSPYDPEYQAMVKERRAEIAQRENVKEDQVPEDAVTASGSGLDPQISRAYADIQVNRVARESGLDRATVEKLVKDNEQTSFNGSDRGTPVNVVTLNLDIRNARGAGAAK